MKPQATARNEVILARYKELRAKGKTIDDSVWRLYDEGWGISFERLRAICVMPQAARLEARAAPSKSSQVQTP